MAVVKFNRDWHGWKSGQTVDLNGGLADIYTRELVAEYVTDGAGSANTAATTQLKTRDIPGPKDPRRAK